MIDTEEGVLISRKLHHLKIGNLLQQAESKLVLMSRVPSKSHLYLKRQTEDDEREHYRSLVQVAISNNVFVYCLDNPEKPFEVEQIQSIGMLMEYGTCLNLGINLEFAYLDPEDEAYCVKKFIQNSRFTRAFQQEEFWNKQDWWQHVKIDKQIFRGYSLFDALLLRNSLELDAKKRKIGTFQDTTILANYDGATVFSLLEKRPNIL
jgi:hypothetical protein